MSQPFHRLHDQAEEDAIKMSAVAPDAAARERMRSAIEEKINSDPFTKPLSGALTDAEWAIIGLPGHACCLGLADRHIGRVQSTRYDRWPGVAFGPQ